MAYPELPPSATFWRCPRCGNEQAFAASGTGHVECAECNTVSTVDQLLASHSSAHPDAAPAREHG